MTTLDLRADLTEFSKIKQERFERAQEGRRRDVVRSSASTPAPSDADPELPSMCSRSSGAIEDEIAAGRCCPRSALVRDEG